MSESNGHLDRAAILAKRKLPTMEVEIPEWDSKLRIRMLKGHERDKWETYVQQHGTKNVRAFLFVYSVCDEDGQLLFTEADLDTVGEMNAAALDRVFEAGMIFNKMRRSEVAELKKTS
jgi:hypothetical protein